MSKLIEMIKPGMFGISVAADTRRQEFDFANEQLLYMKKKIDYLFIGDSITHMWDLSVYIQTGKYLVNRGIGGDNSSYMLKRFDADCIQLHPMKAIMMVGTNDMLTTAPDLWWKKPGADVETVMSEYKSNVIQMVNKCNTAGIEPILCSLLPSKIAPPFEREHFWNMTKRINDFLQTLGVMYVDYHSALTTDGVSLPDELSPDGIHPNAEAYRIMAAVLKEVLDF